MKSPLYQHMIQDAQSSKTPKPLSLIVLIGRSALIDSRDEHVSPSEMGGTALRRQDSTLPLKNVPAQHTTRARRGL